MTLPLGMDKFLTLSQGMVNYTGNSKLVQFRVLNITKGNNELKSLRFDIILQRMYFYHLAATYLPTACLLIIAEITLFIDDSHFEATIQVSLTSMLVMYTLYQSIAVSLPQTAYLKMIDVWLLFGLMMPFIVFLLEVFFELVIATMKKSENEENNKVKNIVNSKFGYPNVQRKKKSSFKIDKWKKIGQISVVTITIGFILMYWCIALFHYYLKNI